MGLYISMRTIYSNVSRNGLRARCRDPEDMNTAKWYAPLPQKALQIGLPEGGFTCGY